MEDVDLRQVTVSKFTKLWAATASRLDHVDLSLITLRPVNCGTRNPSAVEEEAAAAQDPLDPRASLAAAGVTNGCSLLASVADSAVTFPGFDALTLAVHELTAATEAQRTELQMLRERSTHVLPLSVQAHAARCLFQLRIVREECSVGVGVFFETSRAVTASHNLGRVTVGGSVYGRVIEQDDTETELQFVVAARDDALDAALLTCTIPYPHFLKPYAGPPSELTGGHMALCAFQSAIQEELPEFKHRIGVFHALCCKLSTHNTHMVYQSTSWVGDSGASLLLLDGLLVGIHLGIVNDLQRLKEQALTGDDALADLASSVNALIDGQSSGCIALLASAFPTVPA